MAKFTVIVLNWNGKHFLEVCFEALRRQTFRDFETIFVDNGSEDGSVQFVRDHFPEVVVLALDKNIGFAAGNDAGFEIAHGEWIVLLNNDTEADRNWLAELHAASEAFPDTGSFASKMLFFDERDRIDNCGFDITFSGAAIDLGRNEKDGPKWAKPTKVFGACGGAAAYRRSMLDEIGFLDPDFFMTFEDVDLSFRAQLMRYECIFVPNAVVYHRWRGTMTRYPARQAYFSQRNLESFYLKDMPLRLMVLYLPWRIVYEIGAAAYFTRLGVGGAFAKAKIDTLRHLPNLLRKRAKIQRRRRISNSELSAMMRADCYGSRWKKFWSVWFGRVPGAASKPRATD